MALLAFRVQADYEEAIRMREEVARLEKALSKATFGSAEFEKLNDELVAARVKLNDLVSDAARSGAAMQKAFTVKDNEIVEKINNAKSALKEERAEIVRLNAELDKYWKLMEEAQKSGNKKAYRSFAKEYADVESQLNAHKLNESDTVFNLSELQIERVQNAKESELYKYIMNGAAEGSEDAAQLIKENMGDAFSELAEGGNKIKGIFDDILSTAMGVSVGNLITGGIEGGYDKLKGVYDKSLSVRAEMQDIESTMNIFLGSAEKSKKFVDELEDAAYYNMFEFSDLVEGSKQMLAYGHAVDTIIPRMNQLSEVATATHKPLGGLIDMYNRAKSIGYVDTRMQQSFASQGVVIKDVLKEMGVAATGSKISFQQLNEVLDYLTKEGGKFHGIMKSQLNNISAEEGALEDNLHTMYNEIGEIFEGTRIKSLKMQTEMVGHWREIAKAIGGIVAVMGTYRAAMAIIHAAQGASKISSVALSIASTNEAKARIINATATDNESRALFLNQAAKTSAQKAAIIHAMAISEDAKIELIDSLAVDENTKTEILNTLTQLENAKAKGVNAGASIGLAGSLKMLTKAMWENTAAALTNPYVLMAAAVAALVGAIYLLATAESNEEKAQNFATDATQRYTDEIKRRREEEQGLVDVIGSSTASELERYRAYEKLSEILPELTKKYTAFQLSQMSQEERDKAMKAAQAEKAEKEQASFEQTVSASGNYGSMRRVNSMILSDEQYNERQSLLLKNRTKEEEERLRELNRLGNEQAKAAKDLYKELNPEAEGVVGIDLVVDSLKAYNEQNQKTIDGVKQEREEREYALKPLAERARLENEAAEAAKKEYNQILATVNAQNRQRASLEQLQQMATDRGIDISEWFTLDENAFRDKIIEALNNVDKAEGIPTIELTETGEQTFLERARDFAKSLGFDWGAEVADSIIEGEQNAVLGAAEQKLKEATDKAAKTNAELAAIKPVREIRAQAKRNQQTVKSIQRKMVEGDFNFTEVERAIIEKNDKWKELLQTILNQGGINETQLGDFKQYADAAMQDATSMFGSAGGDAADKAAQRAYDLKKMQVENERKIGRERVSIAFDVEQNVIKAMQEGAEKQMRQRDLDHRKEMQKLKEQNEDKIKEAEEAAKSEWMKGGEDREEYEFEADKKAILERSGLYKELVKNANDAYDAQMKALDIKFNDLSEIRSKYDKDRTDYIKQEAETAARLNQLFARRAELEERIASGDANPQYIEELKEVNRLVEIVSASQRNLLDLESKAMEEYVKNYGTTEQKLAQINAEYFRKLDDPTLTVGGRAMLERQRVDAQKKVLGEVLKDEDLGYDDKELQLYGFYAQRINEITDAISQYHSQALDIRLSEEERANAQSLANAAELEKAKLDTYYDTQKMQLVVDQFKEDPTYFMAFRDMSQVSSQALERLNQQLMENAEQLKDLDPDQLKTITDLMGKIDDTVSSRDPFTAMAKHAKEAEAAERELVAAKLALIEATKEQAKAEAELAEAELELQEAQAFGNQEQVIAAQQKLQEITERHFKSQKAVESATNRYKNAQIAAATAMGKLKKDADKVRDSIKEWGGLLKEIGNEVGGLFGEALNTCGEIINVLTEASQKIADIKPPKGMDGNSSQGGKGIDSLVDNAMGLFSKGGDGSSAAFAKGLGYAQAIMQGMQFGMQVGKSLTNLLEKSGVTGEAKYEKYAKKMGEINRLTTSLNRYRTAALLAQQAEDSWFGNSALRDMRNQWEVAQKAQDDYFSKLNERQAAYRDKSRHDGDWMGNVAVGSLAGAAAGAFYGGSAGSILPGAGTMIGAAIGAIAGGIIGGAAGAATSYAEQAFGNGAYDKQLKRAQDNLRIETKSKHRSFMWIGGRNQQTADLNEWVRQQFDGAELFDPDGWINSELAQEILDTYSDKLQGETQKTIEELMELKEQYDEYQEALQDYVNSLYSPLVDNMTDAIWSWYDDGVDALTAFRESASDTFRNIINDMMKQIVLSEVVGTFQDDIKDMYDKYNAGGIDYNTLIKQVSMRTADMVDAYEASIPMLEDMVTTMSDTIENSLGIDMDGQGTNSASQGAFSGMSQDVGNEMNGRLTVIQMQGETVVGQLSMMTENQVSLLSVAYEQSNAIQGIQQQIATSYLEVQGIHEDTTALVKSAKAMDVFMNEWDSHIKKL